MPKVTSSAAYDKGRASSPSGDELSDSTGQGTDAAVKSILNSRKCWRSLKGKEEPVWPPQLEAALVEGAFATSSRSTRFLTTLPRPG